MKSRRSACRNRRLNLSLHAPEEAVSLPSAEAGFAAEEPPGGCPLLKQETVIGSAMLNTDESYCITYRPRTRDGGIAPVVRISPRHRWSGGGRGDVQRASPLKPYPLTHVSLAVRVGRSRRERVALSNHPSTSI